MENQFFFPNACHVCKSYGFKTKLFLCNGCQLISYCSKLHQKAHWSQHCEICKHIQLIRKKTDLMKFEHCTPKVCINKLKKLLKEIRARMTRPLEFYEDQMLMYQKKCSVCFKRSEPDTPLYRCHECASASFCIEHKKNYQHNEVCSKYKSAFLTHIMKTDYRELSIHYMKDVSPNTFLHDMTSFLHMYLIPFYEKESEGKEILTVDTPWILRHTEIISSSLSVLFAMRKLKFNLNMSQLLIHYLSINELYEYDVRCWENLLHLVPDLVSLQVVMIGPYVQRKQNFQLCDNCIKQNKILKCEYIKMPYHLYKEISHYTKPDIIAAFDVAPHMLSIPSFDSENWKILNEFLPPVKMLAEINCPYIFTCREESELNYEKLKINGFLKENVKDVYCGENNFAGMNPFIDYFNRDVSYINQFILIYEKFH